MGCLEQPRSEEQEHSFGNVLALGRVEEHIRLAWIPFVALRGEFKFRHRIQLSLWLTVAQQFVVRDSLLQFRDGEPQLWPFSHVTHCLHALREDTICNADDTPRYTGRLHAQANSTLIFSGVGQTRQCRDWDQLRKHAIENSACYQRPTDKYVPLLDRYKHCPDGSEPWKDVEG